MAKNNYYIEIVHSSRADLSSMGQESCDMIEGLLKRHYTKVGVSIVDNLNDLKSLVRKQPDLVFLGMKKIPGKSIGKNLSATKIWLSTYLDEHGIPYTGSPGKAIALEFNKPEAKQVVHKAGLRTAAYFSALHGQYADASQLPLTFPLFIKPPTAGGGRGIGQDSVVRDFPSFVKKVHSINRDFKTSALVEEYLSGREFSVAIFETIDSDKLMAMPIELITAQNKQGDRILGQAIKVADTEQMMAVPEGEIRDRVVGLAMKVFEAIGARDYGRIDIRMDDQGVVYFLEANLIPGIAYHRFTSYFTKACLINQAMDYETMILRIVELGLSRHTTVSDEVSEDTIEPVIHPSMLLAAAYQAGEIL